MACGTAAVALTVLLVLAAGPPRPLFKDGPPAAVTGGFGQDSCHACHFDADVNDGAGSVTIRGVPDRFVAGETYVIDVTLTRPGMAVGGFQLGARFEHDGEQAGVLEPGPADERRVAVLTERAVQYVQHLLDGIELAAPDTASWTVRWTAPASGGAVVFHAAAVAADGDDSQIGDFVYTTEETSLSADSTRDDPAR